MLSLILHAGLVFAALPPAQIDTPPPPPIPIERVLQLKTMQDVIGASLLVDGRRAPADLVLPELLNRHQTLEFMRVHYPPSMRSKASNSLPIAWVQVDEQGSVSEAYLLTGSGFPELDSLSLKVMRIAWFKPARLAGEAVAVWVPFPARIPPHEELIAALKASTGDVTNTPTRTPYTQKPVLLNRSRVEAAIVRVIHQVNQQIVDMNEAFARSQRVGGRVDMWIYVDESGAVANSLIKKTSGNGDLDVAAQQIARMMRFSPARNGDSPVAVWIEVPIEFKSR